MVLITEGITPHAWRPITADPGGGAITECRKARSSLVVFVMTASSVSLIGELKQIADERLVKELFQV